MALDYQSVYHRKRTIVISVRFQIMAAVFLLAALITKVCIKIEGTSVGYQLAAERQKTIDLDMEKQELELQVSVLLRSDNLARAASEKLGLKPLNPNQARRIIY